MGLDNFIIVASCIVDEAAVHVTGGRRLRQPGLPPRAVQCPPSASARHPRTHLPEAQIVEHVWQISLELAPPGVDHLQFYPQTVSHPFAQRAAPDCAFQLPLGTLSLGERLRWYDERLATRPRLLSGTAVRPV